ncbi:hypothetical protein Hanom_Chr14g01259921 [Helianthus anomalus]
MSLEGGIRVWGAAVAGDSDRSLFITGDGERDRESVRVMSVCQYAGNEESSGGRG